MQRKENLFSKNAANSGAYVKLLHGDKEVTMPSKLFLTEKSKNILQRGKDGQGFIYFVDLDTGEIHLLAANNPDKEVKPNESKATAPRIEDEQQKLIEEKKRNLRESEKISLELGIQYEIRESFLNSNISTLEEKSENQRKIQQLESQLEQLKKEYDAIQEKLKAIPAKKVTAVTEIRQSTTPVDNAGEAYKPGEFAVTTREKTSETGGTGGGDLHAYGEHVLGLGPDKNILAGGFWIKRENDKGPLTFSDFRTRSTINTRLITFNPLYRFIFNENIKKEDHVGHTQVYIREIPCVYLESILDVFSEEAANTKPVDENTDSFLENLKESLSIDSSPETESVIPPSTRLHLQTENDWLKSSKDLLLETLDFMSKDKENKTKTEIQGFVKSFFDKNFVENERLLPTLFQYIKEHPSEVLSKQIVACLNELLHDMTNKKEKITHWPSLSLILHSIGNQLYDVSNYLLTSQGDLLTYKELCIIESYINMVMDHNTPEYQELLAFVNLKKPLAALKKERFELAQQSSSQSVEDRNKKTLLEALEKTIDPQEVERDISEFNKCKSALMENPLDQKAKEQLERLVNKFKAQKINPFLLAFYKNSYIKQADDLYKEVYYIYLHGGEKSIYNRELEESLNKALENYKIALIFDAGDQKALAGQANAQHLKSMILNDRENRKNRSAELYQEALKNNDCNTRQKLLKEALLSYSLVLKIDPTNKDALDNQDKIHSDIIKCHWDALANEMKLKAKEMQSNPEGAEKLESYKNLVTAYCDQGKFYKKQKRFKEAAESYHAALQLDPKNEPAKKVFEKISRKLRTSQIWTEKSPISHKPTSSKTQHEIPSNIKKHNFN